MCRGPSWSISTWGAGRSLHRAEWPDQRDEDNGGGPHQEVEGKADFDEIRESVTTGAEDHHMGLVADW